MLLNALPFRLSLLQISPCSPLSLALFAFLILQCLSSLWDYKLWKDKNLWILVSAMSPRALSQCRTYRRCSRYARLVAEWRTEGEFGVAGESKPSFLSVIPDNFALVWVLAHPHIANLFFLFLTTPMSCGVLVPQPGIEPVPLALEDRVLTTGLLGKSPHISDLEGACLPGSGRMVPTEGCWTLSHGTFFCTVVSLLELYTYGSFCGLARDMSHYAPLVSMGKCILSSSEATYIQTFELHPFH